MDINLSQLANLEQLAQACTRRIGDSLEAGMTEEDAASLMRQWLHQHECNDTAHRALAWFGERTRLAAKQPNASFTRLRPAHFPTDAKLESGQDFVLYCAPRRGEMIAESMYCNNIGSAANHRQLGMQLAHMKTLILQAVNQQKPLGELTQLMQQLALTQGATLCQQGLTGEWIRPYSASPDTGQQHQGIMKKVVELTGNQAPAYLPVSNVTLTANAPLKTGLWVVQPWLDNGHSGAGIRCLLYIAPEGKACWLNLSQTQTKAA